MNYIEWATRHAPAKYPANITAILAKSGAWPQSPYTGIPSSPRMVFGIDKRLVAPVTPKLQASFEGWVLEEIQRHLPDGPPDPIFYAYGDHPQAPAAWPLNQLGQAVPITLWDFEHLVVDQLLTVAFRHPDKEWRVRAAKQALKLRQAVYPVALDSKKNALQGGPLSGQQRSAGWLMDFVVRMNKSFPEPWDYDVMSLMVSGLYDLATAQGAHPLVPLNPYGKNQADHNFCQWESWQIGVELLGLLEVRQYGTSDKMEALVAGHLDYFTMAFAAGKAAFGVDGKMADNMDPSGAVGFVKSPSMPPTCLGAFREADAQGLLPAGLKASAVALRDNTGWLNDVNAKDSTEDHAMGLMILCGGWIGWKGAA